jgi:hypothetical protein
VSAEKERLRNILQIFDARKATVALLSDTVKSLKSGFGKADLKSWRDGLAKGDLAENVGYLGGINAEAIRNSCSMNDLEAMKQNLLPLIGVAVAAAADSPPDIQQLSTDKQIAETGKDVIGGQVQATLLNHALALISFLNSLEQGIREEIKARCQCVISDISSDIQRMWGILHPGETIQEVRLCVPEDSEKAIDIGLKFHGVEQDSPRLTLSEGYRNSLGRSEPGPPAFPR